MAAPVRPPTWPTVAPANTQPVRNDARVAAQKAFFDAALAGKTTANMAQAVDDDAPVRPTQPAAQAVRSVAAAEARATDRLPPPGSLLNILV